METATPKPERPNQFEAEFGSTGRGALDTIGGLGHLVLDRVAQQVGGADDAGRDECEQQRVFDRGNAAFIIPEPREIS